jgi:GH15 family glucan-1,4-alpha-glucosidase
VALDRLLALHDERGLKIGSAEDFRRERDRIRRQIEEHAWNSTLGSYVATLNGTSLDASVLLLPWYGFEDAASPRMRRTYACLRERLGGGRELLYRYRNGEPPVEGAFGVCGFWGAEFLALGGGTAEEAEGALRTLIAFANDVGLFAEEIDPAAGAALGNFPQAFTHVGLINAALSLEQRAYGRASLDRGARRGSSDAAPSEVRL